MAGQPASVDIHREETELIAAAKGGDRGAFKSLYLAHVDALYRFAATRVGHHLAEDFTAETFARAWAALARYEDRGLPFRAWLFRIMRNLMTSAGRRARETPYEVEQTATAEAADRAALMRIDAEGLLTSLSLLPERQRQVLELRFLCEQTVQEVAETMQMTDDAVRALTYRALKQLRAMRRAVS